jgi:hypothetical protein
MSQDAESQVTANNKEADFLPSSLKSQLTSVKNLSSYHSAGLYVMETSLDNFYFANHSQKQQKAKTFLMLSTIIPVLTICHGNHASASAWMVLPLCQEAWRFHHTGQSKENVDSTWVVQ